MKNFEGLVDSLMRFRYALCKNLYSGLNFANIRKIGRLFTLIYSKLIKKQYN